MSLTELRAKKIAALLDKAARLLKRAQHEKDPVRRAQYEADAAKAKAEAVKIQGRR